MDFCHFYEASPHWSLSTMFSIVFFCQAKGEATGPGRVKSPTLPADSKDHKQTEGSKDSHKKESSSSKSHDSDRDQRRESRDKSGKPIRQRITAPSPGPSSERSTSRTEHPRSEERTSEPPFQKKRTHTRSPPARPPPRRVAHSPGGGLHTRRSANTTVLTFASIKVCSFETVAMASIIN